MTKNDSIAMIAAFVGGAIAGAACGILFAPEKGEDQRRRIKDALEKRGVKLSKEDFQKFIEDLKNIGKKNPELVPAEDFDVE